MKAKQAAKRVSVRCVRGGVPIKSGVRAGEVRGWDPVKRKEIVGKSL